MGLSGGDLAEAQQALPPTQTNPLPKILGIVHYLFKGSETRENDFMNFMVVHF